MKGIERVDNTALKKNVAQYPLPFGNFLIVFAVFWLAYIVVAGYITYSQVKKEHTIKNS